MHKHLIERAIIFLTAQY